MPLKERWKKDNLISEDRIFAIMRTVLGPESVATALKATSTATKTKSDSTAENMGDQASLPAASDVNMSIDVDESDDDNDTSPHPSTLTILADAREALSQGMQLLLVTLLDESLRQSRRRRNRSANSSYGTLLHMVLPSRHSQNPERYPMPEASTSMAMMFGPNMKFELSQQEQAAAADMRRINLEFEEGLIADMAADDAREATTGKRKLDGESGGSSNQADKRWFEREVCTTTIYYLFTCLLVFLFYHSYLHIHILSYGFRPCLCEAEIYPTKTLSCML